MNIRHAAIAAAVATIVVAGCATQGTPAQPGGRPALTRALPVKHWQPSPPLAGPQMIDMAWVSARRGWALEAAICGSGLCPRLAVTADSGRTWTRLPAPPGVWHPGGRYESGALIPGQVSFATPRIGYLFGPDLYQTTDGGLTWQRVPGPPVEALQPAAGTVVRVAYRGTGCPGPCTRLVQEAAAGSTKWRTLLRIPDSLTASQAVSSQLIRQGRQVIYVPVYGNLAAGAGSQHTVIFRSTDGGAAWRRLPDPCPGTGTATHDAVGIAAAPGGFLAALCAPRTGTGQDFVVTSADYGSAWSRPGPPPAAGTNWLIVAASPHRLALATGPASGSGQVRYRLLVSDDGGLTWKTAISGITRLNPHAPAVASVGFTTPLAGWWISDPRTAWITGDGGLTWQRQPVPL
ncbi:MAG TPA: hypothetical protein VMA72_30480 [Streptosporangiaceae bacterium]|nr:hypothetical protein [Streptosporangiaceae bacterium]